MTWEPLWSGPRKGPEWIEYSNGHPVAVLLGLKTVISGEDEMSFSLGETPAPNPNGGVHGGLLAAALDHALAVTAMLAMPDDSLPNTAGMNVQYLRPAMPPLDIRARVTRAGKALVFVRAEVLSSDGKLSATSDGTFAIMDPAAVTNRQSPD
jgi:uncharacterized protein (TIGR00369 family)